MICFEALDPAIYENLSTLNLVAQQINRFPFHGAGWGWQLFATFINTYMALASRVRGQPSLFVSGASTFVQFFSQ